MERVRVVVFGCLLVLGLSFCPSVAYAADGFLGGLEDLTGTRQVEQQEYENDYLEGYHPELRDVGAGPVRELPEDATTVDYVNDTLDSFNTVNYKLNADSAVVQRFSLLQMTQWFLGNGGSNFSSLMRRELILAGVGVVFLWWGLRKSIRMIFAGFRKGSASI